jgi:hypothetical protein
MYFNNISSIKKRIIERELFLQQLPTITIFRLLNLRIKEEKELFFEFY